MTLDPLIFKLLSAVAGALLVTAAFAGMRRGQVSSPRAVVHGTPVGRVAITVRDRPAAFWFVTLAYLCLGGLCLAAAWWI